MIESIEDWRSLLFALLTAAASSDIRALKIPNIVPVGVALSAALALFAA